MNSNKCKWCCDKGVKRHQKSYAGTLQATHLASAEILFFAFMKVKSKRLFSKMTHVPYSESENGVTSSCLFCSQPARYQSIEHIKHVSMESIRFHFGRLHDTALFIRCENPRTKESIFQEVAHAVPNGFAHGLNSGNDFCESRSGQWSALQNTFHG